jgi:hypothetical protein
LSNILQATSANWTEWDNRRNFFDFLGNKLGCTIFEDFYTLDQKKLNELGGTALFEHVYHAKLVRAMEDVYPDHKWLPWKFREGTGDEYWSDKENQRLFLVELGTELGITHMDQWHKVPSDYIFKKGGQRILKQYKGSRFKMLRTVFGEHQWNQTHFRVRGTRTKEKNESQYY